MAASISGRKGSISKRDFGGAQRRFRVVYFLFMQGVLALVLVVMAWFSRNDLRSLLVMLGTLAVPAGWGFATWSAWTREEAARKEGRFDAAFARAERKRGAVIVGAAIAVWIAIVVIAFVAT